MSGQTNRPRRIVRRGVVVSDRMRKTIKVRVDRLVRHPLYGKYVKRKTVLFAHDENDEAREGDTVDVVFTRPLSKLKRWRLVRIVERGFREDVAGAAPGQGEASGDDVVEGGEA